MPSPRRSFLRRSAVALLAGATAGCLSDGSTATDGPGAAGTDTDAATDAATPTATGTASPTPTDAPTATETATATPVPDALGNADFAEWLPAPAAFDREGYRFTSFAPRDILDRESDLGDGATEGLRGDPAVPGIDSYADAAAFHQIPPGVLVFEADFDREATAGDLRGRGLTEAATRERFAVFTGDRGAAALGESALVLALGAGGTEAGRSAVQAVVDAKAGAGPRYVDAVADCERLTAALGSAHLLRGRTHSAGDGLADAVAGGVGIEIGERETRVRTPAVFPEGEVDEGALADWAADADVFYGQSAETAVDGRVATAAATVRTAEIETFRTGSPAGSRRTEARTPEAIFGFEYEATGDGVGTLEITHEGGDSIPRAELSVRGTGFADVEGVDQTAAGQWQGTASGDDEAVVAGDYVTVGVASDYEVAVVWEANDGDTSATLNQGSGPDA
ncbi:hypothetical protein C475_07070 [Halosimplex carlsbadense 2-9-1]|uniref:Uncharacterized protein n=1 Tax=Halosimplex carlsbadense 2-9-1 TaxID=797114 RepID=M0CZ07_9EURY|nr:hypothetical protein [Halosimplex carlsbadense]ELZ27662.1 hypothetical protein C475_07070 [Halosimplex carlsbadense 2-9-1]